MLSFLFRRLRRLATGEVLAELAATRRAMAESDAELAAVLHSTGQDKAEPLQPPVP